MGLAPVICEHPILRMRYTKHRCDQTRSEGANLLDDRIDDTLALMSATN
jgi:hypothetical protein